MIFFSKTLPDAEGDVHRGLQVVEMACGIPSLIQGKIFKRNLDPIITWLLFRWNSSKFDCRFGYPFIPWTTWCNRRCRPIQLPCHDPSLDVPSITHVRKYFYLETIRTCPRCRSHVGRTHARSRSPSRLFECCSWCSRLRQLHLR